jgi:hypothetical protein
MNDYKKKQFNNLVINVIKIINKYILVNYNNMHLLSKSNNIFKLIELSQIVSLDTTSKIIKLLVNIYMHKFNIDYAFDNLSDQFLYKTKKETLLNKTNLLFAKNVFLHDLFEKEKQSFKEEKIFINNGFYFNDFPSNGIICEPINKFPNENDGYSIVISFRLMDDEKNKKNALYTIFSLRNKDNNNIMTIFIEDYKIKIRFKKRKKKNYMKLVIMAIMFYGLYRKKRKSIK